MPVYLLMHQQCYEGAVVLGVFSTPGLAESARAAVWRASRDWPRGGTIDVEKIEDLFVEDFQVDPSVFGLRGNT